MNGTSPGLFRAPSVPSTSSGRTGLRCVPALLDGSELLRPRHEAQRHRVHAVAQPGRLRTVVEYMTQMRIAQRAAHFGTRHAEHAVSDIAYILRRNGLPEARPAGAGIVFGAGIEHRVVAAHAAIQARIMPVVAGLRECPL